MRPFHTTAGSGNHVCGELVGRRNQVLDPTSHSEVLLHRLIGTTLLFLAVVRQAAADETRPIVLKPARVFDGINRKAHDSWVVVIRGAKIDSVGPAVEVKIPKGARVIE